MNKNPDVASTWKGRILIQTIVEKTDKPTWGVKYLDQDVIAESEKYKVNHKYQIMA